MDADRFWSLIEQSRRDADDIDEQCAALGRLLDELSVEEIVAFQDRFDEFHRRAYSWDLWGAAYVMGGGCSDDGFMDFRAWLIAQGGDTYKAALQDPDSLADAPIEEGDESQYEGFQYVAGNAWARKTGGKSYEIPHTNRGRLGEPTGQPWDEDDTAELQRRYPRLWERYW
jgi:hypothetical protein